MIQDEGVWGSGRGVMGKGHKDIRIVTTRGVGATCEAAYLEEEEGNGEALQVGVIKDEGVWALGKGHRDK